MTCGQPVKIKFSAIKRLHLNKKLTFWKVSRRAQMLPKHSKTTGLRVPIKMIGSNFCISCGYKFHSNAAIRSKISANVLVIRWASSQTINTKPNAYAA